MFSEKLKSLRKQAKLSQEQLAEQLHVSRQAVTKWETDAGVPEIGNLRAISALFRISLDELLENETTAQPRPDFLFESVTEYDVDCKKSFDLSLTGSQRVVLAGYDGEKLRVRLASDELPEIQSAFKVKIDDVRRRLDVDIHCCGGMTETEARKKLTLMLEIPMQYTMNVELAGNTESLEVRGTAAENIEFSGKVKRVAIIDSEGHIELNTNEDTDILCDGFTGRLDLNQISATSRLQLPAGMEFCAAVRGIANRLLYRKNGETAEDFSLKGEAAGNCPNLIELNGMRSELTIDAGPIDPVSAGNAGEAE